MTYISLIDQLSDLDKKRIKNYLYCYGSKQKECLNPEEWLKYWDHSKQKMYKALGNTLIKEVSFKFEKSNEIMTKELNEPLARFRETYIYLLDSFQLTHKCSDAVWRDLKCGVLNSCSLINNTFGDALKIPLINGKTLQITKEMKIIKVINKIYEAEKPYLKDFDREDFQKSFEEAFEEFKKEYSIILNEKFVEGKLCFSIHPLDFLTMSDNDNRWSSCMSWAEEGCYRVGTIEMMNSNNVICAYIKSKNPFIFGDDFTPKDETFSWNNKKWRQLFYVTKDIITNGKSYPYTLPLEAQAQILTLLNNIVNENLGWKYSFGPEPYKDMIHIHSKYRMDINRKWIKNKETAKHNILFDTKGMYNDFLNDTKFNYLCVRNKVNHNKIISVSGKANCICCNNNLLRPTSNEKNTDYNERYKFSHMVICEDCVKDIPACENCNLISPTKRYITIQSKNTGKVSYCCEECFKNYYKICPICGEIFDTDSLSILKEELGLWIPFYTKSYDNYITRTTSAIYNNSNNILQEQLKKQYEKNEMNILCLAHCCINCMIELSSKENEDIIYNNIGIVPSRWYWGKDLKEIIKTTPKVLRKIIRDPILNEQLLFTDDIPAPYQVHNNSQYAICYVNNLPSEVRKLIKDLNNSNFPGEWVAGLFRKKV